MILEQKAHCEGETNYLAGWNFKDTFLEKVFIII